MKMKVFCEDCEYFSTKDEYSSKDCMFIIDIKTEDTPIKRKKLYHYASPYKENKHNVCPYFKETTSFKVRKIARRIFKDEK